MTQVVFVFLIDKEPSIKDMKLVAGKSAIHFYVSGTGQFQINDANWTALTTIAEWSDASARVMELLLTQEMVDCLKGVRRGRLEFHRVADSGRWNDH